MRPAAILFDLDGTLVSTGGAGKRSIEQAVVDVTGIVGGVNRQRLDGMTDRAIIRTAVDWGRADAGPSCTEDEIIGCWSMWPCSRSRCRHATTV